MSESFVRFFTLSDVPFSKEVQDSHLWLPPSKAEIVEEVCEAVHEHAQVLLVGEPGAGKTCVLRAVRHRLPQAGFRLTYCHNATLGRRDFYRQLCHALGLNPAATAAAVFYAVSAHVESLGRERVHPAFLLDEAHLLHQDTLDHLHILLNYEWDSRALLSLILVGLSDLQDRLELRKNRSLYSRIERRLSIGPMVPDDTAEYVRLRMSRAGADREVFTADALTMLHEAAGSSLREIDRIATAALREAARRKKKVDLSAPGPPGRPASLQAGSSSRAGCASFTTRRLTSAKMSALAIRQDADPREEASAVASPGRRTVRVGRALRDRHPGSGLLSEGGCSSRGLVRRQRDLGIDALARRDGRLALRGT